MADDRRPSAHELEELIDRVRRDPSSNAFMDLGEAYLALGRPRDAIGVCGVGLGASPNNHDGRVLLARAHCALHAWRDAQAELLRVVKGDRNSRRGFALLGEVLLRRNDFERAVPVLQHAQILDPTSPQILNLLKRARTGQPLDPPSPIPEPVPPKGSTNYFNNHAAQPMAPIVAPQPAMQSQPPRPKGPTQPPPPQMPPTERPRVISTAKVTNAAAASLRQSASVGETYLAELLGGGLLEVAGVRVPDVELDLRPDCRWGRSTRRAFTFLFIVVILGSASGGTWWWWSKKQKAATIDAGRQKNYKHGELETFAANIENFTKAADDPVIAAYYAEAAALSALLYGTPIDVATTALKHADVDDEGNGSREIAVAKAAIALATLDPKTGTGAVSDALKLLDELTTKDKTDKWAAWLKGRAQLAGGDRKLAKATFKPLADDGFVLAMIDQADLLAQDGNYEAATKLYDKALKTSPNHLIALVGKAMLAAESMIDPNNLISEYSVSLSDKAPHRIAAYRALALEIAELGIEDYQKADELLAVALDKKKLTDKALCDGGVAEPRFWASIAWSAYVRGDIVGTKAARACAHYFKSKPDDDPTLAAIDAAIALSEDHPDKALTVAHGDSSRERLVRARALLDQGKASAALAEGEELQKRTTSKEEGAEPARDAQIVYAEAFLITETDHDKAASKLEGIARQAQSKLARHALGDAWMMVGNFAQAENGYEGAVKEVSPTSPNPILYRTRTALANVELAIAATENPVKQADDIKERLDKADKLLADAQKDVVTARGDGATYAAIAAVQAKLVLRRGDPDKAASLLAPLAKDGPIDVQLAYAEALATQKTPDKDRATQILRDLKDKVQPPSELGRVARLVDINLPTELAAPVAPDAPGPPGVLAPPTDHHHHHH